MQHAKQVAALRAFEDLVPVRDDPATLGKRVSALRGALGELAEALSAPAWVETVGAGGQ